MPDLDTYVRRVRTGACFVCGIVSRDPAFPDHHIIYEDEGAIVFLAMNPTQYGYTLVAPKEQVAGDSTPEEYLGLQRVVHRVAEAVREEVGGRAGVHSLARLQPGQRPRPLAHRVPAARHPLRETAVRRCYARDRGCFEDSGQREGRPRRPYRAQNGGRVGVGSCTALRT